MVMPMIQLGLMARGEPKVPSAAENKRTTERLIEEWNLGPEVGSDKPGENSEFWAKLAKAWDVEEDVARRRRCANCEYFVDTPSMLEKMEEIPYNEMDATGGGRGFCKKFDFICHNLRTCQAWEGEGMEDEENMMEM